MKPDVLYPYVQWNGIVRIVLVHQSKGRVVIGVKMDGLASPVLQRNIDDQIVGDEHASTELRIDIRCDTI